MGKNRKYKIFTCVAIGAASVLFFSEAAFAKNTDERTTCRIGAALARTGNLSFLGQPEINGAELAVRFKNEQSDQRYKFEIVVEDTRGSDSGAVLAAKKLANDSTIVGVVGTSSTGGSLAIIPVMTKAKIPMVAPVSGVKVINPVKERQWIFRSGPSGDQYLKKGMDYLVRRGVRKVGLLYSNNGYGEDGLESIKRYAADSSELQLVGVESFAEGATDLRPQLAKLQNAGVEAVYLQAVGGSAVVAYRSAKELNIKFPIMGGGAQGNNPFRKAAGDYLIGSVALGTPAMVWEDLAQSDSRREMLGAFVTSYEAAYGGRPDAFAGAAYDGAWLLMTAAEEVGCDASAIRDRLERGPDIAGTNGIYRITAEDHAGLSADDLAVVEAVANDGWKLAEDE